MLYLNLVELKVGIYKPQVWNINPVISEPSGIESVIPFLNALNIVKVISEPSGIERR